VRQSFIQVRNLGYAITIASIVFIVYTISKMDFAAIGGLFKYTWLVYIIFAAIVYALLYYILGYGWWMIMQAVNPIDKVHFWKVIGIYMKTNIAKYIPSNLMHFAGRHMLSSNVKITHKYLLLSNVIEITLLSGIACIISVMSLIFGIVNLPEKLIVLFNGPRALLPISMVIIGVVVVLYKGYLPRIFFFLKLVISPANINKYIRVLLCYIVYFLTCSVILYLIYKLLFGYQFNELSYLYFISVLTVSWLIGYVMPGAPGGIGIREFVLLAFLSYTFTNELAVMSTILLRVINVIGDIIAWLMGEVIFHKQTSKV